jgi:AraC family transcriptional regulator
VEGGRLERSGYDRRVSRPEHRKPAAWAGRFFLMEGRALYVGAAGAADAHAHHAVQLILALSGPVRCVIDGGPASDHEAVIVAPDVAHAVDCGGRPVALLYLEPEAAPVRAMLQTFAGAPCRPVGADTIAESVRVRLLDVAASGASPEVGAALADDLVSGIAPGGCGPGALDRRVLRVIEALQGDDEGPSDLGGFARAAGLSTDRLGHLFSEQVGLPFRTYLLWNRLQRALRLLTEGTSLTAAAHQAGFADSAHLSRTFRRMFGIAPSMFAAGLGSAVQFAGDGTER